MGKWKTFRNGPKDKVLWNQFFLEKTVRLWDDSTHSFEIVVMTFNKSYKRTMNLRITVVYPLGHLSFKVNFKIKKRTIASKKKEDNFEKTEIHFSCKWQFTVYA